MMPLRQDMSIEHWQKFAENVNKMRKASIFTDVTLTCKGKRFEAHRSYLSGFSVYFYSMFSCGLKESVESVVDFPTLEPHVLETILEIMYTGKMIEINYNIITDLLLATHLMQLTDIYIHYRSICISKLNEQHIFSVWDVADELHDEEILKAVHDKLHWFNWKYELESVSKNKMNNLFLYHINKEIPSHDLLLDILILWASGIEKYHLQSFKDLICLIDPQKITNGKIAEILKTSSSHQSSSPLSLLRSIVCIKFPTFQLMYNLQCLNANIASFSIALLGQDSENNWRIQYYELGLSKTQILLNERVIDDALVAFHDNHLYAFTKERKLGKTATYVHVLNSEGQVLWNLKLQEVPDTSKLTVCEANGKLMAASYDKSHEHNCIFQSTLQRTKIYTVVNEVEKTQLVREGTEIFKVTQVSQNNDGGFVIIWKFSFPDDNWVKLMTISGNNPSSNWIAYLKHPNLMVRFFPGPSLYIDVVKKKHEFLEEMNNLSDVVSADVSGNIICCLTKEGLLHVQDINEPNSNWKSTNTQPELLKAYNQIVILKS